MFDKDAEKAYVCSMDPESELGKASVAKRLKRVEIT